MTSNTDLDPAAIERLQRLGGEKFTSEMIRLFISYTEEKIAEARAARQSGDLEGVEKAVHPIKSSAGNVGAVQVQRLASEAEVQARNACADAVSTLIDELEVAYGRVRALLVVQFGEAPDSSSPAD